MFDICITMINGRVALRISAEQKEAIEEAIENGAAKSLSEFVRDAIETKLATTKASA